jgi:O-antigen/teichoic acid export membrane protein
MEAINRFIQSRIQNHYIKDCIVLLGGNGLKITLGFLLNVTLAKFFNPSEFGVYSTLMSVSLICVNITDFGYGNTMNRLVNLRGDPDRSILANTFMLKLALLAIFLTGLYAISPLLAGQLKALEGRQSLVRMLVVLVALESLFKFLLSTLQASGDFSRFSLVLILSNALRLAGVIVLYITHHLTFESILMLYMLSSTLLLLLHGGRWRLKFQVRPDLMKQINRFAIWVWLFIVVNSFFVKSDILLANFLQYDKKSIGNYALVFYFISLIGLLQEALFTQLLPKTSKFCKAEDFVRYYKDIQYIRWTAIALSAL